MGRSNQAAGRLPSYEAGVPAPSGSSALVAASNAAVAALSRLSVNKERTLPVMGFGEVGIEHERLVVVRDRLLVLAELLASDAAGHVGHRELVAGCTDHRVELAESLLGQALVREQAPVQGACLGHFSCVEDGAAYPQLVETTSAEADLVILGLTIDRLAENRGAMLTPAALGYPAGFAGQPLWRLRGAEPAAAHTSSARID